MKKILLNVILGIVIHTPLFSQTLDQQLRQAQEVGQITSEKANELTNSAGNKETNKSGLAALNQAQFFKDAPNGISSLFITPDLIEEVTMGNLTLYYPKGYGNNILHYGIWNAIPFIVFDNSTLELRMGLIFEHRQVGFVPDDWVSSSLTGKGLPEVSFLIPDSKTFLNFTHGSSQWRATVLLTEEQISNLTMYANNPNTSPEANIFTVNHRFSDSSARPYLVGLRHKGFFQMMLQIYKHIGTLPLVKKFRGSDAFPAGAFFEELTVDNVTTEEVQIEQSEVEVPATEPEDDNLPDYYYDVSTSYEDVAVEGEYEEYNDEYTEDTTGDYTEDTADEYTEYPAE